MKVKRPQQRRPYNRTIRNVTVLWHGTPSKNNFRKTGFVPAIPNRVGINPANRRVVNTLTTNKNYAKQYMHNFGRDRTKHGGQLVRIKLPNAKMKKYTMRGWKESKAFASYPVKGQFSYKYPSPRPAFYVGPKGYKLPKWKQRMKGGGKEYGVNRTIPVKYIR
jgi:hypothetical protein